MKKLAIILILILSSCGTSKPTVIWFEKDTICKHDYSVIAIIDSTGKIDSLVCWKCGKTISAKDIMAIKKIVDSSQMAYQIKDSSDCGQ